ncbi:MAG TPA: hypothetical protein VFI11_04810 [Anaerolineales bacterium]|nr:hypothetical protein [Anaerolineales bacterium]
MEPAKPKGLPSGLLKIAAICALISLAFKAVLLALEAFPFYSDEAIVGLMARHILSGRWPTFFYGQAYLGSTDAALVAGAFAIGGESVLVIRIVQALLYAGTVATTVALALRAGLGTWGTWGAGLLAAIPVVNTTLYTTVSIGGYGEALLLGNLLLLATIALDDERASTLGFAAWGALAGFAFWTFGLTLVYSLPSSAFLLARWARREPRGVFLRAGAVIAGGILGAAPLVVWGLGNGFDVLIRELTGSAIAGASSADFGAAVISHGLNLLLFGPTVLFGARPPWEATLLAIPLLPFAIAFWILAIVRALHPHRSTVKAPRVGRLLAGVAFVLIIGFLFTPFGADPSGRYFLPLSMALTIVGGALIDEIQSRTRPAWAVAALAIVLAFSAWGNLQTALRRPPGITTQFDAAARRDTASDSRLMAFLGDIGETRGYTTYWISYPLAFLSRETLVFVPRLPYHSDFRYTSRDDRYPGYGPLVLASPRVAYITSAQPWLEAYLREAFASEGVTFRESEVGGYHVFHDLSRAVAPETLGIVER